MLSVCLLCQFLVHYFEDVKLQVELMYIRIKGTPLAGIRLSHALKKLTLV